MTDANEMSDGYTGDEDQLNEMSDGYLGSQDDPVPQYAPMSKNEQRWLSGLFGFATVVVLVLCYYMTHG